jgi:hypothetical protein
VAVRVPQQLPRNKLLRRRYLSYLHRMVECLEADVVPHLPQARLHFVLCQCAVMPIPCTSSSASTICSELVSSCLCAEALSTPGLQKNICLLDGDPPFDCTR